MLLTVVRRGRFYAPRRARGDVAYTHTLKYNFKKINRRGDALLVDVARTALLHFINML